MGYPNFWSKDNPEQSNSELSEASKKYLSLKYLQNLVSTTWLKLGNLNYFMKKIEKQEEVGGQHISKEIFPQGQYQDGLERNQSINWMDSVDPSLYSVIFSSQKWY